jgi:ankyrin repeat protein
LHLQVANLSKDFFFYPAHRLRGSPKARDVENSAGMRSDDELKSAAGSAFPVLSGESSAEGHRRGVEEAAPNISLNVHAHGGSKVVDLGLAAIFGIILQSGFLVFVGATVYHPTWKASFPKDTGPVPTYAYPLMAAGTLFIAAGMMICSAVIEQSTAESKWVAGSRYQEFAATREGENRISQTTGQRTSSQYGANSTRDQKAAGMQARVLWLQKNHTVSDQNFDSYIIFAQGSRDAVLKSHRNQRETLETKASSPKVPQVHSQMGFRRMLSSAVRKFASSYEEGFTLLGTFLALSGFILQFTGCKPKIKSCTELTPAAGLRGLNWTASIAQLVAIALMTIVRAWLRRGMITPPVAARVHSAGHEIDWLALKLASESNFWDTYSNNDAGLCKYQQDDGTNYPGHAQTGVTGQSHRSFAIATGDKNYAIRGQWSSESLLPTSVGQKAVRIRQRLGHLTKWVGPASQSAIAVAGAIENAMDALLGDSHSSQNFPNFTWSVKVQTGPAGEEEWINFTVRNENGHWKADATEIEAALSLWLYHVQETERLKAGEGNVQETTDWLRDGDTAVHRKSTRFLGPKDGILEMDLGWWLRNNSSRSANYSRPSGSMSGLKYCESTEVSERMVVGFIGLPEAPGKSNTAPTPISSSRYYVPRFIDCIIQGIPTEPIQPLSVISEASLDKLLAQHLFSGFMWSIADSVPESSLQNRHTTVENPNIFAGGQLPLSRLENIHLLELLDSIDRAGLGSLLDVSLCVIPPLSSARRLPDAALISFVRKKAENLEILGQWDKVVPTYIDLIELCSGFHEESAIFQQATAVLVDVYRNISSTLRLWKAQYREGSAVSRLGDLKEALHRTLKSLGGNLMFSFARIFIKQGRLKTCEDLAPAKWRTSDSQRDRRGVYEIFGSCSLFSEIARGLPLADTENFVKKLSRLDHQDILGWSFLHYAVLAVDEYMIDRLLDAGLSPDTADISGFTPLHYAAINGTVRAIPILLQYGANVDSKARDGTSPIHLAKDEKVAAQLLQAGANVELQDNARRVPLHHAAFLGYERVVKLFLEKGAFALPRDEYGRTALHLAMISGNAGTIRSLLELSSREALAATDRDGRTPLHIAAIHGLGPKATVARSLATPPLTSSFLPVINARDRDGRTPFHLAVLQGHTELVDIFLEWGADSDLYDNSQGSALHFAAHYGHHGIVELLIKRGSDIEARYKGKALGSEVSVHSGATIETDLEDTAGQIFAGHTFNALLDVDGSTPLHIAASQGHTQTIRVLLKYGAKLAATNEKWTALHFACHSGHLDAAKLLLSHGSDIHARDESRQTPLIFAACWGHEAVLRLLLKNGADIEAADLGGMTALHFACEYGHEAALRRLLEHGANIEARCRNQRTPLHFAAQRGRTTLAKLLLEKGADPNTRSSRGSDALRLSTNAELCELLLAKGADVKAIDNRGFTQLHSAVNNFPKAKLLVQNGVDITLKNNDGENALHLAALANSVEVATMLLDKGLGVNEGRGDGSTPLMLAARLGNRDMVKFLLNRGADKQIKNCEGHTAFDITRQAANGGVYDEINQLLQ